MKLPDSNIFLNLWCMFEMFEYAFMQNAFIVWACLSLLAPVIGIFLIIRRYTMISDTLSHISLTWVMLWLLSWYSPFFVTLVYTVLSSLLIERMRLNKKLSWDVLLSLLLSVNLAVVALILSLNSSMVFSLSTYLFGSISLVSRDTMWLMVGLFFGMVTLLLSIKNSLLKVTFDEDNAQAKGIPVKKVQIIFVVMVAMLITLALPISWVLLMSSLIVLPVVSASQVARSFRSTVWIAEWISFFWVLTGITLSFYFDISASGSITLLLLWAFILCFLSWIFLKK